MVLAAARAACYGCSESWLHSVQYSLVVFLLLIFQYHRQGWVKQFPYHEKVTVLVAMITEK